MIPSIEAVEAALRRYGVAVPSRSTLASALARVPASTPQLDGPPTDAQVAATVADVMGMAQQLAALPPPTRKDDVGFAGVTDRPMRNYIAYVNAHPNAVPLDYHYRAATALSLHKHTQLGTERVESAIRTLHAAMVARGLVLPPERGEGRYRMYAPDEGTSLPDGSAYSFNAKTGIAHFTLPRRRDGTRVFQLLRDAGIERGVVQWTGNIAAVQRKDILRVIDAIRKHYPDLADAVDHMHTAWGLSDKGKLSTPTGRVAPGPSGAPGPIGASQADEGGEEEEPDQDEPTTPAVGWSGTLPTIAWTGAQDAGEIRVHFSRFSGLTKAYLGETALGQYASWVKSGDQFLLAIRLSGITLDARKALAAKSPEAAYVVGQLVDALADARKVAVQALQGEQGADARRVLRQIGWMMSDEMRTRFTGEGVPLGVIKALETTSPGDDGGVSGDVSWHIEPDDVTLVLRGLPRSVRVKLEERVRSVKATKNIRGEYEIRCGVKHTPSLARALDEQGIHDIAAQLRVALLVDGLTPTCVELEELATAFTPDQVDNKQARAWVGEVDAALKTRLAVPLMPYQTIGVTYGRAAGYRFLCADEMGLGKTAQAIGCVALDPGKLLPAIVICPSSVVNNWRREFNRFYPKARVTTHTKPGALPPRDRWDVVILSWDRQRLQPESVRAWKPQLVIADEVHNAKNAEAARTKALHALASEVPYLIELSGTPMPNRPIELFSLLYMIDPLAFPDERSFGVRYANAARREVVMKHPLTGKLITREFWDDKGSSNVDELRDRLRCNMIRRTKAEVAKDLPPLMITLAPIEMTEDERAEYERIKQAWIAEFVEDKKALGATPAELYRALFAAGLIKAGKLRRYLGRVKVKYAIQEADTFLRTERRRLLIFAEHDDVVHTIKDGLVKLGWRVQTVQGDASPNRKQKIVDEFTAGEYDVLIGTRAISEGMNLQGAAADALCVEYWWTPKDFDQAFARLHRKGQTNTVWIRMLHAEGTYDDYIEATILEPKRRVIGSVLNAAPQGVGDKEKGELPLSESMSALDLPALEGAFSRWLSSDYTDRAAARALSTVMGFDVWDRYHTPHADRSFWDGELEARVSLTETMPAADADRDLASQRRAFYAALEDIAGEGQTYYFGPFLIVGDRKGGILGKLEIRVMGWGPTAATPHVHLAFIGVSPEERRKGLGHQLLRIVTSAADRVGLPIDLEIDPQTDPGEDAPPVDEAGLRAFYTAHGFKRVPKRFGAMLRLPRG